MGQQFDFHPRFDFLPVFVFQQLLFEALKPALGCADDIERPLFAQIIEVLFAGHAAVHRPDALGGPVLCLHKVHDLLDGGDIGAVAIKDFISQGKPIGRDHQSDADLFAVRALIAAVAALRLGITQTLALEVSAGDVVKQELEARAKEAFVAVLEMTEERLAQWQKLIQAPVEPVVIHRFAADSQQVIESRLCIPALAQRQFGSLRAEPADAEDGSYRRPIDFLAPAWQVGGQKIVHPQPPPKRQSQIDHAKLPEPLHSHPGKIDLRPLRRR
jgi:hypothetical protein